MWRALVVAVLLASPCAAQIPNAYQDLHVAIPPASPFATTYAGQLTDANCNNGPGLLQPSSFTLVQNEILLLKAVGAKAISVEVSFPMLGANFFTAIGHPEYQSQFLTFYANVSSAIRAQGLQVIVESQSMIPTGLQSTWGTPLQKYHATSCRKSPTPNRRSRQRIHAAALRIVAAVPHRNARLPRHASIVSTAKAAGIPLTISQTCACRSSCRSTRRASPPI